MTCELLQSAVNSYNLFTYMYMHLLKIGHYFSKLKNAKLNLETSHMLYFIFK